MPLAYLQYAADNLLPDIVLVRGEERRFEESVRTAGDVILREDVFALLPSQSAFKLACDPRERCTYVVCGKGQIRAQDIVDEFVRLALRRDDFIEFYRFVEISMTCRSGAEEAAGLHTIPELLRIIQGVRDLEVHCEIA